MRRVRSNRARALLSTPVIVLALLGFSSSASAFVYWADTQNQRIGRASNDGTGVIDDFVPTGQLPFAIALDSAHIYWANQNSDTIGRANIDGSGVDNSFMTGINEPSGVAVTASHLYWSTIGGQVGRANLDGTARNASLVTGVAEPCGLAVDSGHLYWADIATGTPAYIGRAGLDGSGKQLTYVTIPVGFPCGVAVNSSNIFWSDPGIFGGGTRIGRANVNNGGGVDTSFIGDASTPCGVAVSGAQLYWANAETNTIGRANTDGTNVNQSFIATNSSQTCAAAVDSLASPPADSAGSTPVVNPGTGDTTPPQTTIAKGPGGRLAKGVAKFRFRSSEPGSRFACKLDKRKAKPCRSPKSYTGLKPGRHVFKVWATDAAGNKDPTPAKRRFRVPAA